MNTEKAIKLLREMQEAWKLQITGDAYDALEMAIKALQVQDKLQDMEYMCRLSGGADYFNAFRAISEKVKNTNTFLENLNNGVENANANSTNEIENRVKGMTACRVPEVAKDIDVLNTDCISRREAIEKVTKHYRIDNDLLELIAYEIEHLPSVQPEIIRCKDCRWRKDQSGSTAWLPCRAIATPSDFYCGRSERRTDE